MATSEVPVTSGRSTHGERRIWDSKYFFPVLLLFILIAFYWKLTLTKQFDWVWGPDLAQQVLPWWEEEARQIQHSELPLWDPHTWNGQPMLGQAQPGTAYPLNWILFLIPRLSGHIPRLALQWYFIVVHFMAALFAYLLCRDLSRSRGASLIAGLVYSLTAYVGTTDWPQMVNAAVWVPMVFLFLLRSVRGYRPLVSSVLCGTALGTAWLAGHHQVPIYTTLAMGGTWLYYILRSGRINWNVAKLAAVALIVMILVGALQIIPAEEYGHLAKRWAGADHELRWDEPVPYYVHREYSLYPMSLFAILIPGLNRHADPFIGVVAFSLALLAVALGWKHPMVKLFSAVAIGGIVYSLGNNSIFQGFIYAAVPMVEKARVPSMAVVIWGAGIAVLVAFGIDFFATETQSVWGRRLVQGVLGFGLLTYAMLLGALFMKKLSWDTDDRIAVTALVTVLLAALLHAWRSRNLSGRAAVALLTMVLLLELGNNAGYALAERADKDRSSFLTKVTSDDDIATFLHQQPGPFRIEVGTEKLSDGWGNYHNFDLIKALLASVTVNVLETEFHTWQNRLLFGVRYTISEKPPLADSKEVFTGASGLKVFENPGAFPRAWAIHEVVHADNPGVIRSMVTDHLEEFRKKAFTVEKAILLPSCDGADQVDVKKYAAEKVTLSVNMACQGMVVLSDTYFPGWRATVDGKSVEIHQVNNAMRAVMVPRGTHEIVMKYRPASVYFGLACTLFGWLGALALTIFGPKGNGDDYTV